jgi:DNA-binding Xre family transcriptional regulator
VSNYARFDDSYAAAAASYYGSIEHNLERLALERGFVTRNGTVNLNTLSAKSGISTSTLWYLLKDKTRFRAVNMVTLAKLCWTLGVQPGDLFTYVPGGTTSGLGYSSDAFTRLLGARPTNSTQPSDENSTQGSDIAGDGGDSERGTPDPSGPVSTPDAR